MIMIYIGNYLKCVVDQNKDDCNREAAHCHVKKYGKRVAQIWLNPVEIEPGHLLKREEADKVKSIVSKENIRYKLEQEYINNKRGNIDSVNKKIYRFR